MTQLHFQRGKKVFPPMDSQWAYKTQLRAGQPKRTQRYFRTIFCLIMLCLGILFLILLIFIKFFSIFSGFSVWKNICVSICVCFLFFPLASVFTCLFCPILALFLLCYYFDMPACFLIRKHSKNVNGGWGSGHSLKGAKRGENIIKMYSMKENMTQNLKNC